MINCKLAYYYCKKEGTKYALFVIMFSNSELNNIKQAIFCSFTGDLKVTRQVLNAFYESLLLHDPPWVSGKTGIICINIFNNVQKHKFYTKHYRSQLQILSSCARHYTAQQTPKLHPVLLIGALLRFMQSNLKL